MSNDSFYRRNSDYQPRSYSVDTLAENSKQRTVTTVLNRMDRDCYYSFCGSYVDYPDFQNRGVTCFSVCCSIMSFPCLFVCTPMACSSFSDSHFLYDTFEDNEMRFLLPYLYIASYPTVKLRRSICLCAGGDGCYDFDIKDGFTDHHVTLCGEVWHALCHCPLICPMTSLIRMSSSSNYSLAESKITTTFFRYYGLEFLLACRLCICCCGRKFWGEDSFYHSDSQDLNGYTGILGAVKANNMFPYNTLITFGANPDIPDHFGRTPLFYAAKKGNMRFVRQLISDGCDVFHRDDEGVSPFDFFTDKTIIDKYKSHKEFSLYYASQHGYADILQSLLLLDNQIIQETSFTRSIRRPFDNKNPLELACQYKHQSCVDILIDFDPLIDPGYSLHYACEAEDEIMISSLLELRNIDIAKKNEMGLIAFSLFKDTEALLLFLADQDFSIESLETNDYSLWFYIIQQNSPRISQSVQKYVKKYPELITCKDVDNRLALDVATEKNKNAIKSVTLWFGRYRLIERRAEHVSSTCMIFRVLDEMQQDDSGNFKRAAIKIMKVKSQFLREVNIRNNNKFDPQYIMSVLASYPQICDNNDNCQDVDNFHIVAKNVEMGSIAISREIIDKMYCIVMPLGDRNLFTCLKSERWSGPEYTAKVRSTFLKIIDCVQHLHNFGVLHGDIKTLNIIRVDAEFVLIDLDAACLIDREHVGMKSSAAYVPPEAIFANKDKKIAFVKSLSAYQQYAPDVTPDLLVAHSSFDVWSLGCILYQLCTDDVRQLFQAGQDDNLSSNIDDVEDSLFTLAEWSESIKIKKLNKISNTNSRNLVSMMLSKDPNKRPTLSQVKDHPFLSLHRAEKTIKVGLNPIWQVFISYRVSSDVYIARELYDRLKSKGVSVWWDKVSLIPGKNWKEGFCEGLVNCPTFVCIISRNAINNKHNNRSNYSNLNENSSCDNVLLEHRLALEMRNMGHIQNIFPVMVGDEILTSTKKLKTKITHDLFFENGCLPNAPNVCVTTIEQELRGIMELMGLGTPLEEKKTVSSILSDILQYQGAKIEGDRDTAIDDAVSQIFKMI